MFGGTLGAPDPISAMIRRSCACSERAASMTRLGSPCFIQGLPTPLGTRLNYVFSSREKGRTPGRDIFSKHVHVGRSAPGRAAPPPPAPVLRGRRLRADC